MFLYPVWAVLVSVPCVYLTARYTRNSLTTLVVSLCFLASSLFVLFSFCAFTAGVTFSYLNGLLIFEWSRFSLLASLFFVMLSVPCLIFYLSGLPGSILPQASALIHLLMFCALGSLCAGDLLSFAILFEGVSLFGLALVVLGASEKTEPYEYLLYMLPFLILLLFVAFAADGTRRISALTLGGATSLLLAMVLAARLLLFPFGEPVVRCLTTARGASVSYVLFALPNVAFCAFVKFLNQSVSLGIVIMLFASFSMIVWALLCYREKEPGKVMLYSYLGQTATVTAMIACGYGTGLSGQGASFLIVGNHVISGLGMLLCVSLGDSARGRFGNMLLMVFIFCMLGLPPSLGFFGRLALFKTSFAVPGMSGYLLRLSFLINLFIIYCQSKHLAPILEQMKSGSRTPRAVGTALGLLAAYLAAAMLLLPRLRDCLAGAIL